MKIFHANYFYRENVPIYGILFLCYTYVEGVGLTMLCNVHYWLKISVQANFTVNSQKLDVDKGLERGKKKFFR